MSDTTSDAVSDGEPDTPVHLRPPRPPVGRSQRQILEKAHTGLTARYTDITDARLVQGITSGTGGELLKLTFDDGEIWWVTAVRGDER